MTMFVGEGVSLYVATALKQGLKMWSQHHIKVNRAWTPRAMMARAAGITGKQYKPRDYDQAIRDLETWIALHGPRISAQGDVQHERPLEWHKHSKIDPV